MSLIRRMFGGNHTQGRKSSQERRTSVRTKTSVGVGIPSHQGMEEEAKYGTIRRNMDDEHFASGMPGEHPSLSDKLDNHKAGTLFKYAVITNAPSEERSGMLNKLRSYKPQSKIENLTLGDIAPIRLVGDTVNFPLKSAVDPKLFNNASDFMLVDCIMVHFVPLDSFANDKSVVMIQVNDFRKSSSTVARTAKIDNTMGYNILFCLDYCVETRDADKITLSFSCPSKNFQDGISWATVKVVAQLQFLSFPKRVPLIETLGTMLFSDTDLENFQCDPRELDLVLTPHALSRVRESHQRGEIENLTIPKNDKSEMITAKTILGFSPEEDEVSSQIGKMKEIALLRQRQQEAQLENRRKLDSLNRSHHTPAHERTFSGETIETVESESCMSRVDEPSRGNELLPGDSSSMRGDTRSEVDDQIKSYSGHKMVRISG